MHHFYKDILDRFDGPPLWFDENAVPRYESFAPDRLANIYSNECALVAIECQSCATEFNVAFSELNAGRQTSKIDGKRTLRQISIAEQIARGTLHYGDPPNTQCCAAGPSMNSVPIAVLEYWQKVTAERTPPQWVKEPSLEREIKRPKLQSMKQHAVKSIAAPTFHNISSAPEHVAPFSHAVGADNWVILTGQMPTQPDGGKDDPLVAGIQAQTAQVMENLKIVLDGIGLGLEDIVQCRCFLTEFERDYAAFNDAYQSFFPADRLPARTTVGVTALAVGALVEIDCIARRPE
jgi:reactive intermediate/imine deaminase